MHAPWLELTRPDNQYLHPDSVPKGFNISDPSKLAKQMIDGLCAHWQAHKQKKLPIIEIVNARPKDLDAWKVGLVEKEPCAGKRKAYIEVDDNSNDKSRLLLLVDKGKAGTYSGYMDDLFAGKDKAKEDRGRGTLAPASLPKPPSK